MVRRGARRATLAVALLTAVGALWGCASKPEIAPVTVVLVRATDLAASLAEAGIDASATAEAARGALASSGLRIDEGARRGYRATIEIVAVSVGKARSTGGASAEVVLEMSLEQTWAAGPSPRRTGKGSAPLAGSPVVAWRSALRQASTEAAAALVLDLRALQKGKEQLEADLVATDPRVRERAVRALSSKGARGAIARMAPLVRDPDPVVARAAVDAIAAFRDPAAVVALINAAQAGDAGLTLRLLPVLVEIGGPDVEGYLLTLEAGHPDPGVRRAASEGLARLGARRPNGAGTR